MASLLVRVLGRLAVPIVEEATVRIYCRRLAEAEAADMEGLERVFYSIFGASRLSPGAASDRRPPVADAPPSAEAV
jgi:hypothetical protein